MNEKFFSLHEEKQQAIINAGYRVFSQNSYKNSPMSEIAAAAGISKSLLFHYFQNKKELYLFLWDKCAETTIDLLTKYGCYDQTDLFESMERGMHAKMEIIRLYPNMANFTIKAFYEKDVEISAAVQETGRCTRAAIIRDGRLVACDSVEALSNTSAKRVNLHGTIDFACLSGVKDKIEYVGAVSFLYSGDMASLVKVLSSGHIEDLTITEPDLEEVFMHYYEKGGEEI